MRATRLSITLFISAMVAGFGCGGGEDPPDPMTEDPGLTGLGQKCGPGLPVCPSSASECIGLQGTNGNLYCTPKCVVAAAATGTEGNGFKDITPPANPSCTTSFTGAIGTGVCGVIMGVEPMDNPIVVNKEYSNLEVACYIQCGAGSTCPGGTSAAAVGGDCACIPD